MLLTRAPTPTGPRKDATLHAPGGQSTRASQGSPRPEEEPIRKKRVFAGKKGKGRPGRAGLKVTAARRKAGGAISPRKDESWTGDEVEELASPDMLRERLDALGEVEGGGVVR